MASAVFSQSTAADHTVVAAPGAGKFIRVFGWDLIGASAVSGTWKSGSTAKSGAMPLATRSAVFASIADGFFDCAVNEALVLTLSGAVAVTGIVSYQVCG